MKFRFALWLVSFGELRPRGLVHKPITLQVSCHEMKSRLTRHRRIRYFLILWHIISNTQICYEIAQQRRCGGICQFSADFEYMTEEVIGCHFSRRDAMLYPIPLRPAPEIHITTHLWAENPTLVKEDMEFYAKYNDPIKSQFCTCHDSSAVVACATLWLDWIIRIKIRANIIFMRFQSGARKSLVTWSPGDIAPDGNPCLQWCCIKGCGGRDSPPVQVGTVRGIPASSLDTN